MKNLPDKWYVYMLCCRDNSYYTGITKNISRRLQQHNNGNAGAKYTRSRRPVTLVYQEQQDNHSSALKREMQIKQLRPEVKRKLAMSARSEK